MQNQLLSARIPGQSVMAKLASIHLLDPPRTFLGRFFGSSPLGKDSWSWYQGAVGEVAVAGRLATLGPDWTVLHSVPVGKAASDIDHVIVGPGGVFTINTKNHASQPVWVAGRTFMVAGQKQRHIPNSVYEARRASNLLSRVVNETVRVRPLIVVVSPRGLTIKEPPADVVVLTDGQLVPWLRRQPPVLGPSTLRRLAEAAVQPGTWRQTPLEAEDPIAVRNGYESLRALVERAGRRRAAWRVAVLAGPIATLLIVSSGVPGSILRYLLQR